MMQAVTLVSATALSYIVALAIGWPWLLPFLNSVPAYSLMLRLLHDSQRERAVRVMLLWAAALIVFGTAFFLVSPGSTALRGTVYRDEMFQWIRTGEGVEGDIRLFLPQHLLQIAIFVISSLATAGLASVVLGSFLMNTMSFYVASLARHGTPGWAVVLLGWQPWALCRVAAFCILGVVLAEPLLSRIWKYPYGGLAAARRLLAWAAGLLLSDWILKAFLAPLWGDWLRGLSSLGVGSRMAGVGFFGLVS
jgi:hypothetical protein